MKIQPETIIEETQRESIINRPHNLAGSVQRVSKDRFSIKQDRIEYTTSNVVPAMLKLFQEAIDNSIDVGIKSGFAFSNKIEINVTNDTISVRDNGYGISTDTDENGEFIIYKALCKYNTSSNYDTGDSGQKGVNGLGIKLCTTLSALLLAESDDGKAKVILEATENNLNHSIKKTKSKSKGMFVSFKPDFKLFEIDEIDQEHIDRMYEYTLIQALTYPEITFKFNSETVKYTPKKFLELFNKTFIIQETNDYFFAIMSNEMDDFKQISFVNGLETARGGSHINYVMDNIISGVREKLLKKFRQLKPGDIRNKLQIVMIAKNFKGAKWDGQTKESITNTPKDMSDYFKEIDFNALNAKILKNSAIIDPITEVYKLKEELKRRQDLKGLEKTTKKIKSEKYLPATKHKKYLIIAEGASAVGGISPVLGRENCGYYELKGKPLNAWTATHAKFTANKELSELYKIIQNEGYEYIVPATDQDLDGIHIRGLLLGFIQKYLPHHNDKVCLLQTPIVSIKKGGKLIHWYYNLDDYSKADLKGVESKYLKGLGSWSEKDLKDVVKKDGLDKMLYKVDFTDTKIIDDWLGDDVGIRKEYIQNNKFSIALL